MCGIAGIYFTNKEAQKKNIDHSKVQALLRHRGPDAEGRILFENTVLYHSRLSIVDTGESSAQPFTNNDKSEALVFNGEIFNYPILGASLGPLKSSGDVEVLFKLLQTEGATCLDKLRGFFAFAYYNDNNKRLLLVRDRFGVKPLYYYKDDNMLAFASELKPLMEIVGKQELNSNQLYSYFRFNYSAGSESIFKNIYRLLPGQLIEADEKGVTIKTWYDLKKDTGTNSSIHDLLDEAVKMRLHADVPLGCFLSGGLDSSIISALAIKYKPDLETFSIGFKDAGFFDETGYSELVAKHINSRHHVFSLTETDFLSNIEGFMNSIDEPFADASAFNFFMLSKYAVKHVKVALSGDGADELFKGYNKHRAFLLSQKIWSPLIAKLTKAIFQDHSGSRDGKLQNKIRQLKKFALLGGLSEQEKLKVLTTISSDQQTKGLLALQSQENYFNNLFNPTFDQSDIDLEDRFDLKTVLVDDMLVKADRFSMRQGLEIRNPFLDHSVVEYALGLEKNKKINLSEQKITLKESFGYLLPKEILKRSKKGFELPLQRWLSSDLNDQIEKEWLNMEKIVSEKILNYDAVRLLKQKLKSKNPGDSAAQLWAVIVFEKWFENFKDYIKEVSF